MPKVKNLLLLVLLLTPLAWLPANAKVKARPQKILHNAPNLDPTTLKYALKAYNWATKTQHITKNKLLTIIDFNQPSYAKRLWVIDLSTSKILINSYTTQGKNSGLLYAKHFSNKVDTAKTSLGVYKTLDAYHGKYGLSLHVAGLEPGINNNARRRAIVFHPAKYASPHFVQVNHRAGRSWGCFALDPAISTKVVNLIKNGSVVFAYATPEQHDPFIARF